MIEMHIDSYLSVESVFTFCETAMHACKGNTTGNQVNQVFDVKCVC